MNGSLTDGHCDALSWRIELKHPDRYVLVTTQGDITTRALAMLVDASLATVAEHQCPYVLVDHRNSQPAFSTMDIYYQPQQLQARYPVPNVTAALVFAQPSEQTDFLDTRFANTATRAHVFYNFDLAQQWLLNVIRSRTYVQPDQWLSSGGSASSTMHV
jgi:hypothetical protein